MCDFLRHHVILAPLDPIIFSSTSHTASALFPEKRNSLSGQITLLPTELLSFN
jgi:hypothetical protein